MKRVLIIGGYGNFGSFIAKRLASENYIQLIIGGRSLAKATEYASRLNAENTIETLSLDIHNNLASSLASIRPDIVIHTSGPFQSQSYEVAEACIAQGCHYIDLADGRDFVEGIAELNSAAKNKNVLVISGASSVPCLTGALIDHYKSEFETLQAVDYGITTAQKTNRGLATTAAILGYTGKPFKTMMDGNMSDVYGWQNIHGRKFPELGWRLLGNCDIPDLSLFPKRYPGLRTIRFYAGLEIPFIHVMLWVLSWLVRVGLIRNLEKAASILLKISFLFDRMGTDNSGFYMKLSGADQDGKKKNVTFDLIARSGDGPYIPCMPAILLAQKLAKGQIHETGAHPCLGFISLDEYLSALENFDIKWNVA